MIPFGRRCRLCGVAYPTEQVPSAFPEGDPRLKTVCVNCRPKHEALKQAALEKRREYQRAYYATAEAAQRRKDYKAAYSQTAAHAVSQHRYWAKKAGREPSI